MRHELQWVGGKKGRCQTIAGADTGRGRISQAHLYGAGLEGGGCHTLTDTLTSRG